MKYRKNAAKGYAREHMRGIWAAAMTPFAPDPSLDEPGYRFNMRHWIEDLKIHGLSNCNALLHPIEIQLRIVADLPPLFEQFYSNIEKRRYANCGTVHPGKAAI